MTAKLDSNLLNDTLNVVQLARQAALAKGLTERVDALDAIAASLCQVASINNQDNKNQDSAHHGLKEEDTANGSLANSLLQAVQQGQTHANKKESIWLKNQTEVDSSQRNLMVSILADTGRTELEIAKEFGITREEVRTILGLFKANEHKE